LVKQLPESKENTLHHTTILLRTYECFGLLENNEILFRMKLNLVPLEEIIKTLSGKKTVKSSALPTVVS
jgi:hypothetical protein